MAVKCKYCLTETGTVSAIDDTVFEKVPLSTPLEGSPVFSAADGSSVTGSNAICRLVLSKQDGKAAPEQKCISDFAVSCSCSPRPSQTSILVQGTTLIIGPNHAIDGKFIEEWLEAAENALERAGLKWFSELRGAFLFSALSLADVSIWAALFPALAPGGVLAEEEKAKYPALMDWFKLVDESQPCKVGRRRKEGGGRKEAA
eukprot:3941894-Rhodomonas_salina.2